MHFRTIYCFTLISLFFLFNCTNRIYHMRFNPDIDAYQAGFAKDSLNIQTWQTLRDPHTKLKITDEDTARILIKQYNELNNEAMFFSPSSSMFTQYRAGYLYFNGTKFLQDKKYQDALSCFNRAIAADSDLVYCSDIQYLRSVCLYKQDRESAGSEAFLKFKNLSESAIPYSFNLPIEITDSFYTELYHSNGTKFPEDHFSRQFDAPFLKYRPFPGFLPYFNENIGFNLNAGGTFKYPSNFFPMIEMNLDLINNVEFVLGYTTSENTTQGYFGIIYQLLQAKYNRVGITISIFNSNTNSKNFVQNDFKYNQYIAALESGYFVHPRLGLFAGIAIHYQSEDGGDSINHDKAEYFLWSSSDIYGGASYYFTEFLGISLLTGNNQLLKFGILLGGSHIFFQ